MAQNVIINGVTYSEVPEVDIPKNGGGTAKFFDTAAADISAGDVLAGKTGFGAAGEVQGSMADNGDVSGSISTKTGTVTVPAGYTSGGTVGIDAAEQAKLIAGNIRSGVTILGQAGSSMVLDTTIASGGAAAGSILSGKKAFVNGALVTGEATMPTVSQDSVTKVLSIA